MAERPVEQSSRIGDHGLHVLGKVLADLGIALSLVMVAATVPNIDAFDQNQWTLTGACLALFTSTVLRILLSRYVLDQFGDPFLQRKHPLEGAGSLSQFARDSIQTYRTQFSSVQVTEELISILLDTTGYFDRINEQVTVKSTWFEVSARIAFRPRLVGSNIVPIIAQPKGRLIDNLSFDSEEGDVVTLSYIANQGATLAVISTLLEVVGYNRADRSAVLEVVANPQPAPFDGIIREIDRLTKPADFLVTSGAHVGSSQGTFEDYKQLLTRMIRTCATAYFIFAEVVADNAKQVCRLTISQRQSRVSRGWQRVSSLRSLFGLVERDHAWDFHRASETTSYHLSFQCPKGMYLYRHRLAHQKRDGRQPALPDAHVRRSPLPQLSESRSLRYYHLYLRDYPSEFALKVSVSLRERPPALLELGLLLSTYLGVTVWTVGKFHDQVFATTPPTGSWPTVLFGIPTLLSGWLLTRISGQTIQLMSPIALLLTVWLAGNAGLAVLVAAFKSGSVSATEAGTTLLGLDIQHPLWAFLMLTTGMHLALSALFSVSRAGRYWITLNQLTFK